MEAKKSEAANNERLRLPIALMGLLFVGGLLLASFTYTSVTSTELRTVASDRSVQITYEEVVDVPEPVTPEITIPPVTPPTAEPITIVPPKPIPPGPPPGPPTPPGPPPGPPTPPAPPIVEFPDIEATFPGGAAAMQQWINNNVVYPEMAVVTGEQGRVYLSFVVEADGTVTNVKVERGVSKDLDREAKRVVRKMPKWVPGEAEGEKARTRCRLPIIFTLE